MASKWYLGDSVELVPEVIPAGDKRACQGGQVMGSIFKKDKWKLWVEMSSRQKNIQTLGLGLRGELKTENWDSAYR